MLTHGLSVPPGLTVQKTSISKTMNIIDTYIVHNTRDGALDPGNS